MRKYVQLTHEKDLRVCKGVMRERTNFGRGCSFSFYGYQKTINEWNIEDE